MCATFARHKVWTAIGIVMLLALFGSLTGCDLDTQGDAASTPKAKAEAEPKAKKHSPRPKRSPSPSPSPTASPTQTTPRDVPEDAQAATVVSITDGDTLKVEPVRAGPVLGTTQVTDVRLLEIDTPETVDPSEPVACYGPAATAALTRLAPPNSRVWLQADQELTDQYDRTLLYLWSMRDGDAQFVNLALVRNGYAKAVLYEPNDRHITAMRRAESKARTGDKGLWGACPYFGAPLNTPSPEPEPTPNSNGVGGSGGGGNCDPNYSEACIPPYPPDLDCTEIPYTDIRIVGSDPNGFDADDDGYGCDS